MREGPANDLLLRALALEETPRTPVWVMRQAGRYLPEYRKLRAEAGSFMKLCGNPQLACAVTMQPVERFDLDAAIVFSDILTIPDGLGMGLRFTDGEGPWLERPVRDEAAVTALGELDPGRIAYVGEAVKACKLALSGKLPLIGFAGAPFTLACYMIDGRGGEFLHARAMLHARPDLFAKLVSTNARAVVRSLVMQANAGADVLMLFDSWAGLVTPRQVDACLVTPLRQIMAELVAVGCRKPVIVFWRNACEHAVQAMATGVAGLSVDWRTDLAELSRTVGGKVALQGNLDPAILLSDPATIRDGVRQVVAAHGGRAGHIFNLGHGISKDTPIEHLEIMIAEVRASSAARKR